MARAILTSKTQPYPQCEPLYEIDPRSGATIEIFYADDVLAKSFGTCVGWFFWSCLPGCLPEIPPVGPFTSSYRAYRSVAQRLKGR